MEWYDILFASEWNLIDVMSKLLEPIAHHSELLQVDSMALSNSSLRAILNLDVNLHGSLAKVAVVPLSFQHRFEIMTEPTDGGINLVPAAAYLLDPTDASIQLTSGKEPLQIGTKDNILMLLILLIFNNMQF